MKNLLKGITSLILFFFANIYLSAHIVDTVWTKTFGGSENDIGYSVQQTDDGGYIITGYTRPFSESSCDVYLIKTNSVGDTLWTRTFGGQYEDIGYSVQQTNDGGYIVAGYIFWSGSQHNHIYLIKTDSLGDTLWTRTFGESGNNRGYSVQQTNDGGYIITGSTTSHGAGSNDVYLIKTDSLGDTLWTRTFGGNNGDYGYSVQQTTDDGYIVAGYTYPYEQGETDIFLIKTDSLGDTLWTRIFGGNNGDYGYSVQQTTDDGYIVAGVTYSYGVIHNDVYLAKTDSLGNTLWTKTFAETMFDYGHSVQQTDDGGYIVAGYTYPYGPGEADIYLVKTDSLGNRLWTRTFGGNDDDRGYSVQQTDDGGYIVTGRTGPYVEGDYDVYLIKIELFPGITVISPNGGEDLKADSTYDITWMSYETSGAVRIEYSLNNGLDWTEIIASTPDTGIYTWTAPDTVSYNCLISISDTNGSLSDTSDETFTIFSSPYIRVISPNGGEEWYLESRRYITWGSAGTSGNMRIEYSINNGLDWITISDSAPDEKAYSWKLPITEDSVFSDSCLVRITDLKDILSDISDSTFSILIPAGIPTSETPEIYTLNVTGIATSSPVAFIYTLPEKINVVKFSVYNIAGLKIKEEIIKETPPGFYSGKINMEGTSKGIYFIRMEVDEGKFTQTKKFLLM